MARSIIEHLHLTDATLATQLTNERLALSRQIIELGAEVERLKDVGNVRAGIAASLAGGWPPMGSGEKRKGEPDRDGLPWLQWFLRMVYEHAHWVPPGDARLAMEVADSLPIGAAAPEPEDEIDLDAEPTPDEWISGIELTCSEPHTGSGRSRTGINLLPDEIVADRCELLRAAGWLRRERERADENAQACDSAMKWVGDLTRQRDEARAEVERLCIHGAEPTSEEWVRLRNQRDDARAEVGRASVHGAAPTSEGWVRLRDQREWVRLRNQRDKLQAELDKAKHQVSGCCPQSERLARELGEANRLLATARADCGAAVMRATHLDAE